MSCDLLTEGSLRSISILNHKSGIFPRHKNMWAIFLPTKASDFCLVWEVFPNYPLLVTLSLKEYLPSCPNLKQSLAVWFSLNWRHMSIVALGVRGVGKNQGHHTWMTWSWPSILESNSRQKSTYLFSKPTFWDLYLEPLIWGSLLEPCFPYLLLFFLFSITGVPMLLLNN